MNFVLFYALFTYCAIQTTRATPPPKKEPYFQIEEFIKQLMTSEKFGELTDVIAEKTAQIIRNMESQTGNNMRKGDITENKPRFPNDHVTNKENDPKSKKQTNKSRSDEKTNNDREISNGNDPKSKEKTNIAHENNKKENSRSDKNKSQAHEENESYLEEKEDHKPIKFGKIDKQRFLKNHMTSKGLELNYSLGELEKRRSIIKKNNPITQKVYGKGRHGDYKENRDVDKTEGESNKSENLQATNEDYYETKNYDSKETKLSDDRSNENTAHEQANFHDSDSKNNSEENKSTNDSNENDSIGNEETEETKSTKDINFNGNDKIVPHKNKQKMDIDKVVSKSLEDDDDSKTFEEDM